MKKSLLAAALLAGLSSVAHAETTSVELYGILDAGVGYTKIKGNDGFSASRFGAVQGNQSGSRFGMRGKEDLGDGLSAIFTLEGGFTILDGKSAQNSRLFGRQATLGLNSNEWGKIEFGRQTNIASKFFGPIDPFAISFNTTDLGTTFGSSNSLRVDNLALYQSPVIGGFQFGVGYSFNDDTSRTNNEGQNTGFNTADNNRLITTGINYKNGPVYLAASYDRLNPTDAGVGGQSAAKPQEYSLGGVYDFEVVKVHAAFSQTRDGWFTGMTLGTAPSTRYQDTDTYKLRKGFRANSYMVGLTAPIGARTALFTSYQRATPNGDGLTGDDHTFNIFGLGATYELSKRTNFYAYGSYANNYAFQEGVKEMTVAVGLRHRF